MPGRQLIRKDGPGPHGGNASRVSIAHAIPWDAAKWNWLWRCAERVDATVAPFNVFDVQALAHCQASTLGDDDE